MRLHTLSLALLLVAATPAAHAGATDPAIAAAIASTDRPAEDVARDPVKKPAETLALAGVKPGMTVLDVNAGGGYFEEILSRAVGPKGKVIAFNGPLYAPFGAKGIEKRDFSHRLPNVEVVVGTSEAVDLPAESVDVAIMVQAYHDYWFKDKPESPDVDVPAALASIRAALKPGGKLLIVDHIAKAGSPATTGGTLHRIDPALVRSQLEAAGFTFKASGDALRHADDTLEDNVFKEDLRGKTDQFMYLFTK